MFIVPPATVFDSLLSGAIPAIGLTVGAAAVKIMNDRRKAKEQGERDKAHENKGLETRVTELTEVLAGTPATRFKAAEPGIVKRFDSLEQKVDSHGDALTSIQQGIDALKQGQVTAADLANGGGHK